MSDLGWKVWLSIASHSPDGPFCLPSLIKSNLDSTFVIVTRLHAGKQNSPGSIPDRHKKYNIYLLQSIQIRSQDNPVSYLIATGSLSSEVIRLRYADHSPHTVLILKMGGSIPSCHQMELYICSTLCLHGSHRDNFTLSLRDVL